MLNDGSAGDRGSPDPSANAEAIQQSARALERTAIHPGRFAGSISTEEATMLNRYPASCRYCGGTIPPECGTVEKVGQVWKAAHPACVEAHRKELAAFGYGSPAAATQSTALACLALVTVFGRK
jgi:hypothetical protein